MNAALAESALVDAATADDERRFGGLRRLHGEAAYRRLRAARIAVVGVGGVGSWVVEALARSGVASLTLIDFDQIAESNINRQVQALGSTVGMAKVVALRDRIADIHPTCRVQAIESFVESADWMRMLPEALDAIVDACDEVRAKAWVLAAAKAAGLPAICVGAAGGKTGAERVEVSDLADVTHDPLLAAVRHRLRREHEMPRQGALGVRCVHSKEAVRPPVDEACAAQPDHDLNCHGYGSTVTVTATFGFVAAGAAIAALLGAHTEA